MNMFLSHFFLSVPPGVTLDLSFSFFSDCHFHSQTPTFPSFLSGPVLNSLCHGKMKIK